MDTVLAVTFARKFFKLAAHQLESEWFAILLEMVDQTGVIQSLSSYSSFGKAMKQVSVGQFLKVVSDHFPPEEILADEIEWNLWPTIVNKGVLEPDRVAPKSAKERCATFQKYCRDR